MFATKKQEFIRNGGPRKDLVAQLEELYINEIKRSGVWYPWWVSSD
jgi:hypothetical protein